MIFKKYRSLVLNGTPLTASVLKSFCRQKIISLTEGNWERTLYKFIFEWLSDSNSINAHTSGTTGAPKEFRLSKDKMIRSALMTIEFLNLRKNDRALLCLSTDHIAGKMMVVRAFAGGLNLAPVEPSSNPLTTLSKDQKIDFAAFVPLQVSEILSNRATANKFSQIKNVIIGGAPVLPELQNRLKKFRNNIYETYGMTETISHVALKKLSNGAHDYFTTLPGIAVKADERNCLVIRAPHISDVPVVTNDIIVIKDERHFKWVGRFDNVVNSGGVKLVPELLEEKIKHVVRHRYFFAGIPDDQLGEKLVLVIEGRAFSKTELNRLKTQLSKRLDRYEIPKEIIFTPKFKTTENGKIQRMLPV